MTADELTKEGLGRHGAQAHAALMTVFGLETYHQAVTEVCEMMRETIKLKPNDKFQVNLNYPQALILATFYTTGIDLMNNINDKLKEEKE